MSSTVAIIMRAFNEMPYVQRSINMLARQTFRDFDLYAVDSGSTDGTLKALQATCPAERLTQIQPEEYIPGQVLNDAIARTNHANIVLLNADAVPLGDDFLETLLQPIVSDRADAVFARQVARPDARFIVNYDYQRGYDADKIGPDFFSAVACAFTRALWEKHRFREAGYAEDLAWAKAGIADGARFRFVDAAVVEHSHNYTLRKLYRKRFRQAATLGYRPNLANQSYLCLREMGRDLLHAGRSLKLHTIPYNMAYRTTIHAAMYRGLKEGFAGSRVRKS